MENTSSEELERFLLEVSYDFFKSEIEEFFYYVFSEDMKKFLISIGPNETSKWIEDQGPKLLTDLKSHVSKKMPRSFSLCKVEDHVSKFIEDIIRRDAIGKRKVKGEKTYLSQVKAWAVRNAHTQNRDAGVDALSRCMHGALTRREWENPEYSSESWTTTILPKEVITLNSLESENSSIDGNYSKLLDTIQNLIFTTITKDQDTISIYMKVLISSIIEGNKIKEVSSLLAIESREVSSILSKIKKLLRSEQNLFSDFI